LGSDHTLASEIHWGEFFSHILYHFPHVTKNAFRTKYSKIQWKNNGTPKVWKLGKTGFPINAGMRQLNETGFMRNRVRMIVVSFLTKDLHIDWKYDERYFAEKLIDCDLTVNNGNW
jgi:deoxyribodipyrimidine photo-lyase